MCRVSTIYYMEFQKYNTSLEYVISTHQILTGHGRGHTNFHSQISEVQDGKIGCSFLATESASHYYILLTLNINIWLVIPVATLFVRVNLQFVSGLKHYFLLILFALYEIALLISLIKGGRKRDTKQNAR